MCIAGNLTPGSVGSGICRLRFERSAWFGVGTFGSPCVQESARALPPLRKGAKKDYFEPAAQHATVCGARQCLSQQSGKGVSSTRDETEAHNSSVGEIFVPRPKSLVGVTSDMNLDAKQRLSVKTRRTCLELQTPFFQLTCRAAVA